MLYRNNNREKPYAKIASNGVLSMRNTVAGPSVDTEKVDVFLIKCTFNFCLL